jgi:hypothetical protein
MKQGLLGMKQFVVIEASMVNMVGEFVFTFG